METEFASSGRQGNTRRDEETKEGHMSKQSIFKTPLIAGFGLAALLATAPAAVATDAAVAPVKKAGNPKCADFHMTPITKFDPVKSGSMSGITLTKPRVIGAFGVPCR